MAASRESPLERYDLLERIAVGGMAEVFLAKAYGAHGFEKKLAIKRILPELARDPEFQERFISEAKLAVRLSHANIVQVLDFGRFDGTLFLAMEYVDGLDLAALLQRYRERGRQVPLQAAFHIALELARGLDFAHLQGVIHRDVSPSNILLSRAGEVKIADFGIAVPDAQELRRPSRRRRIMGKWRYMSPEQTRGEDLQTRSDLFAAAVVLFELFTGDKLFPGDEPEAIIQNIHQMEIPSVAARRPGLPPRLDAVLREALARDPAMRPARAAEMQRALVEISYESNILVTPLEVAAAVAEVLEPDEPDEPDELDEARRSRAPQVRPAAVQPMALDDLIRQQLGAGPVTERRTAVGTDAAPAHGQHHGPSIEDVFEPMDGERDYADEFADEVRSRSQTTLVKTGVGADGVTQWVNKWDLGDGDSGSLLDAGAAPERAAPVVRIPGRPLVLLIVTMAVMGAVATASAWLMGRQAPMLPPPDAAVPVDAAPADAPPPGPAPARAPLFVMSTPPGAQVWIDGRRREQVTPAAVPVRVDEPHRVELVLEGHERHVVEGVTVSLDEPASVSATLVPTHVLLSVSSSPRGAVVRLGSRTLGTTPLSLRLAARELPPGRVHAISISKKGYRTVTIPSVALEPGEPVRIERELAPVAPRFGIIQIHVENSWADVYLGEDKVGRAPVEALRLPAGKHRLRLHNPISEREAVVDVDVDPDQQRYYRVAL